MVHLETQEGLPKCCLILSHLDFTVLLSKLVTVDWPPSSDSLLLEEVIPLGVRVPIEELLQVALVSISLWPWNLVQVEVNGSCTGVMRGGGGEWRGGGDARDA